jgi:hypothetical protein
METFTGQKTKRQLVTARSVASYRKKFAAIFLGIFETFRGVLKCLCIYSTGYFRGTPDVLRNPGWETLTWTRRLERAYWKQVSREYGTCTCLQASTSNSVSLSNRVALHHSNTEHVLGSINIIFKFSGDVKTGRKLLSYEEPNGSESLSDGVK